MRSGRSLRIWLQRGIAAITRRAVHAVVRNAFPLVPIGLTAPVLIGRFDQLGDSIWSVREDCAIALGDVLRTYDDEALPRILGVLTAYLERAKAQPSDMLCVCLCLACAARGHRASVTARWLLLWPAVATKKHGWLRKPSVTMTLPCTPGNACSPAATAWARVRTAGKLSCGNPQTERCTCCEKSLQSSPLLLSRCCPSLQKWCVLFWVTHAPSAWVSSPACSQRPQVSLTHFTKSSSLHETVWKQLPAIAQALGPRVMKRYLELFLEPMVRALTSHARLLAFAAGECVAAMQRMVRGCGFVCGCRLCR